MLHLHKITQHDGCSIVSPERGREYLEDAYSGDDAYALATTCMLLPPSDTDFSNVNRAWTSITHRFFAHTINPLTEGTLLLFSEKPYYYIELLNEDGDYITDSSESDFQEVYANGDYENMEYIHYENMDASELVRVVQSFNIFQEYMYNYIGNYQRYIGSDFNKLSSLNFKYYGFKQHLIDTNLCERL